eukprot:6178656-Pleurochrysis_carterae.AAC.2
MRRRCLLQGLSCTQLASTRAERRRHAPFLAGGVLLRQLWRSAHAEQLRPRHVLDRLDRPLAALPRCVRLRPAARGNSGARASKRSSPRSRTHRRARAIAAWHGGPRWYGMLHGSAGAAARRGPGPVVSRCRI